MLGASVIMRLKAAGVRAVRTLGGAPGASCQEFSASRAACACACSSSFLRQATGGREVLREWRAWFGAWQGQLPAEGNGRLEASELSDWLGWFRASLARLPLTKTA